VAARYGVLTNRFAVGAGLRAKHAALAASLYRLPPAPLGAEAARYAGYLPENERQHLRVRALLTSLKLPELGASGQVAARLGDRPPG
jgi:hypothetical protein